MNPYFQDDFGGLVRLAMARAQAPGSNLAARALAPLGSPRGGNMGGMSKEDAYRYARGDATYFGVVATIAAATTATITTSPQLRCIPQRLTLTSTVANAFTIGDIRVGIWPVLGTVGAISAAIFIQDSCVEPFDAAICEVGNDFSVTVTNLTGAAALFAATVVATKVAPH